MLAGEFAGADPEAWSIVDGKLYLNFSPAVRDRWRRDAETKIEQARQIWNRVGPRSP